MNNLFTLTSEEKTKYKKLVAIALEYKKESAEAPKVTAKGAGAVAEKIIETARKHGVEIVKDEQLTSILAALDLDDYIPYEAYGAVSAILAHIYKKNSSMR